MSGIDASKLEEFIKKNEHIYTSINDNKRNIVLSLKKLDDSYDGKILNDIFAKLITQDAVFNDIMPVLENYILLLKSVKKSYIQQDENLSQYVNKM